LKKLYLLALVFAALAFTGCETCSDCSYTFTNTDGEEETVSDDFCSEDSDEVSAFEASFELDAVAAGTTATCTR